MKRSGSTGFTLIELLMVIAVAAILIAILLPGLARVRKKAAEAQSASNLRQIFTGFVGFAAENGNRWPAPQPRWSNAVLPYVALDVKMQDADRSTDDALKESIFISPGWVFAEVAEDFGDYDNFWRQGYGMNILLPDNLSVGARYAEGARQMKYPNRVLQPSRAMLLMDSMNALAVPHFGNTTSLEASAKRYDGKVSVLFCDGHVQMVTVGPENSDSVFHSTALEAQKLFWFGATENR